MNKEEIIELFDKVKQIGIAKAKAKNYANVEAHFDNISYDENIFEVNFSESSHGYYEGEDYWFEVSLDELEQDIEDILAEQKRLEEERIAKNKVAAERAQAILDKQNKEKEYQSYLRLKQKFENEPI